jgi:hypothetical protein
MRGLVRGDVFYVTSVGDDISLELLLTAIS